MMEGSLLEVHLRGVPVEIWKRASSHQEAILREFEIMRASESAQSEPNRLLTLIEDFDARLGAFSEATRSELDSAAERVEETVDLTFRVPPPASAAARQLATMLSEVDAYCLTGDHLLTLATPPELLTFREWLLDEFTRQADHGKEPLPWASYASRAVQRTSNGSDHSGEGHGSETVVFEGSLDLATVGELRDAIQQVRKRGLKEVVVDLTEVGFVDSIGLGLLVTTHSRLEEEGMRMRLIALPRLKKLLELTGLSDVLKPEDPVAS